MKESSLARNSMFFVFYKLLTVLFPLITVSYVSQVLLASGVGKVSSAQNIVQYFVLIASLGIPNYGVREIAKVRNDSSNLNKVFSELFSINSISTGLCTIIYYVIVFDFKYFAIDKMLYLLIGLTIILNFFNVDWFYQGIEEYSYITKRSFVVKVISLILLLVFVRESGDYLVYALIYIIGIAGNNFINCINLKKYGVKFSLSNTNVRRHIKPVFVLLCTTVAIELYTMVDTTMLTFMCPSENVAYYANSTKIVRLVIMLVTAIGAVLLPRLSYYSSQGKVKECEDIVNKVFRIIFFLLLPCGIGICMLADSIVLVLFGNSFLPAVLTLKITSFLIYALGFSNLFGTQVLLTFGDEKKLLIATIVGAVTNISLNAVLISSLQQNGAAIASIISESFVTVITFIFARRHLHISLSFDFVCKTIISSVCMIGALIIIRNLLSQKMLLLVGGVVFGAFIYLGTSIMLRNDVALETISMLKKKRR